jgi:hypothetical protein
MNQDETVVSMPDQTASPDRPTVLKLLDFFMQSVNQQLPLQDETGGCAHNISKSSNARQSPGDGT